MILAFLVILSYYFEVKRIQDCRFIQREKIPERMLGGSIKILFHKISYAFCIHLKRGIALIDGLLEIDIKNEANVLCRSAKVIAIHDHNNVVYPLSCHAVAADVGWLL